MRYALALLFPLICAVVRVEAQAAPMVAQPYQRALTREARALWGLNAPVAAMGAEIEQESGWNPDARSAYAGGLAQFTPQTAAWISGAYRKELGENQPFNPQWAIRALVRYDFDLRRQVAPAASDCDHWGFTLSAYNGGAGNLAKDRAICRANDCDPTRWFGEVERFTSRAPAAAKENRAYPRRILLKLQSNYADWGNPVSCKPGV